MKKVFQTVQKPRVTRTSFNLSHEKKLSFDMGQLIPIMLEEVLPGDNFKINTEFMMRVAPMLAPLMHRVNVYIHVFKIPNRILWPNWEEFITGNLETTVPTLLMPSVVKGSIYDYMGLPGKPGGENYPVNALPFRAYKAIYNEYFRDQNLVAPVDITDDANQEIFLRAWEKDYFTSALPFAQKGEAVKVPFDSEIEYKLGPTLEGALLPAGNISAYDTGGGANEKSMVVDTAGEPATAFRLNNLDSVTGLVDINDLRTAHRIQRWLEKNARAGTRYVEHLLAHWGIRSSDARLDRPEYMGGSRSPLVISEVMNTTGSTVSSAEPVGELSGHGLSVGNGNIRPIFCEEHGWIMAIMSVVPNTAYYQGIHRKFDRKVPTDYYFPEFARLGEQAIKRKELWIEGDSSADEDTWGYQSRFAEYKYATSGVHGEFRDTLEYWHLGRDFGSIEPVLNQEFIECEPSNRIFAVPNTPQKLWCQVYHNVQAKRPMPYYADPTL